MQRYWYTKYFAMNLMGFEKTFDVVNAPSDVVIAPFDVVNVIRHTAHKSWM